MIEFIGAMMIYLTFMLGLMALQKLTGREIKCHIYKEKE